MGQSDRIRVETPLWLRERLAASLADRISHCKT